MAGSKETVLRVTSSDWRPRQDSNLRHRFRKPALFSGLRTPENANEHRVFAFSKSGAFRCSVSGAK